MQSDARIRVLSPTEKHALLSQFSLRYRSPLRNLCMIRLMLEAGLRCGEVISLEIGFLDLENARLRVRGARARDRIVPLGDNLVHLIRLWLYRRPRSRWLFSTRDGNQLDTRYVRDMVKRYAKRADLPQAESVSPRVLRYTYAADLYGWSHDLNLLQKRLGHHYRSSTVSYMKIVATGMQQRRSLSTQVNRVRSEDEGPESEWDSNRHF
ncbi:MAG: tyrosine-type recombinase/integrase [Bacillota bacterium]